MMIYVCNGWLGTLYENVEQILLTDSVTKLPATSLRVLHLFVLRKARMERTN